MRKGMIYLGVGIFVLAMFFMAGLNMAEIEEGVVPVPDSTSAPIPAPIPMTSKKVDGEVVNWERYNYNFVDENVKGILSQMFGANEKTAFYLPSINYINVSRGSKYGVAYALNNPNPSGENYFEFNWTVDDSVFESCGVSKYKAQKWIERGWTSWGKIPKGWIDHMTVYFSFPVDIEPCNVKYNFVITKDGVLYDSKVLEFNLV